MSVKFHTRLAAGAAALALALSACSSEGGRQTGGGGGGGGAGSAADLNVTPPEEMTVSLITHAAPGDTFWDLVRKGAEDAAAKNGINLEYTSDPDGAAQANLINQAVDKGVDGIAVTLAKPDALRQAVRSAVDKGIPVVTLNAGGGDWQDTGAMTYFGQDEVVAGEAAGQRLKEDGYQKVLCVIQEQGHVGLEARCDGAASTGPATEKLYVTGTDMPNVQAALTSKLQQDQNIDAVLMLGAPFALTAAQAVEQAGSDADVATFDMNADLVSAIQAGDVVWAVDQQPYLQGYLSVDALWLNQANGHVVGGGQQVLTGPAFVDETNVDSVAEFAQGGTR